MVSSVSTIHCIPSFIFKFKCLFRNLDIYTFTAMQEIILRLSFLFRRVELMLSFHHNFWKDFIFLFLDREMEGEREGNICVGEEHWLAASCMGPDWGPVLQPRHLAWPGKKLATFRFVGWHPVNWATQVRALFIIIKKHPIFILSHSEH